MRFERKICAVNSVQLRLSTFSCHAFWAARFEMVGSMESRHLRLRLLISVAWPHPLFHMFQMFQFRWPLKYGGAAGPEW
jgi:hypothetical protein